MNPRVRREFGALVMLLILLMSGLTALSWNARAQANEIVGLVQECGSSTTFIGGATVTLTDANGLKPALTKTTGGDGTFSFSPEDATPLAPGYYHLKVRRDGYFENGTTAPFRFDDTATIEKSFCLEKQPTLDRTLSLLVVTAASTLRTNEVVNFPTSSTTNENAAPTWNAASDTVTVQRIPISSLGLAIRYERRDGSYNKTFVNTTDYQVQDYWAGRIKVLDLTTVSDLDADITRGSLFVSYTSWTPTSRLAFFPVDNTASVTAKKNGVAWPKAGNWALDNDTGQVTVLTNAAFIDGTDTLTFDYSSVSAVSGATVDVYYAPRNQVVASKTTDGSGRSTFTLFSATFEVRTTRLGFAPNVTSVDMSSGSSVSRRVRMEGGVTVVGHAREPSGRFLSAGLQGWLYSTDPAANPARKVIRASVVGSLYTFNAPPGTYVMVIDANGKRANVTTRTFLVSPPTPVDAVLQPAVNEEYRTTIAYGTADWNNLTVYRNLTLNPDTMFPGLTPDGLRDIRLQVDHTFGTTKDGVVDSAEATAFQNWLIANGPLQVTSDGFFTTNGKAYLSATTYDVTVEGLTTPGSKVWINATATYSLKDTPYVQANAARYFVNITVAGDTNVSVRQDQVYEVVLPRGYEMVSNTTVGPTVKIENFTRVTIDPDESSTTTLVRMTVERSANGTARAKVAGPAGKFHVANASFDNFRAYVANDTNITFSAEDSSDPVGDITKANFTWRPYANVTGPLNQTTVWGIRPTFKYNVSGEFVVNLTVVEAGGNKTYRNITVWVDDQIPIAKIQTNRTGSAPLANGTNVTINEDQPIRFSASASSDQAYVNSSYGGNRTGVILDGGYAWDFNGDGITDATTRIVNWTFDKPGNYTVNLTVTDGVGWKSVNATINVTVNDTTAPVPSFVILDPSNEWEVLELTATLTEGKTYAFNASRTTDNYNNNENLTFEWTIPGPIKEDTQQNRTFTGMNVTFTWTEFNSSYKVTLKVKDKGFGSGKPNTGTLERSITVGLDAEARPNLQVQGATLRVDNTNPADGDTITIEVNVTNPAGRGTAQGVTGKVSLIASGATTELASTLALRNQDGSSRDNGTIGPGETVTVVFTASVTGQGNKTLQVFVTADREAWTQLVDNRASTSIDVRPSFLQTLALYGSIAGVLILFVFYMVYRRKVRAGDWRPLRARRREKAEGEERKPKKEIKEEKKRL